MLFCYAIARGVGLGVILLRWKGIPTDYFLISAIFHVPAKYPSEDGSGNGAVHQLETVEYSLKLYCSQLSLQCQKLLLTSCRSDRPSPPPSPPPSQLAQWQSQLKQLEEEKSRLLE